MLTLVGLGLGASQAAAATCALAPEGLVGTTFHDIMAFLRQQADDVGCQPGPTRGSPATVTITVPVEGPSPTSGAGTVTSPDPSPAPASPGSSSGPREEPPAPEPSLPVGRLADRLDLASVAAPISSVAREPIQDVPVALPPPPGLAETGWPIGGALAGLALLAVGGHMVWTRRREMRG